MWNMIAKGLVTALVGLSVLIVFANVASPSDAAVPSGLAPYVSPARDLARDVASPAGWWPMPLRLARVGCSADGIVIYAFDTFLPSDHAYALMQLAGATDTEMPGDASVIASLSLADFQDPTRGLSTVLDRPRA